MSRRIEKGWLVIESIEDETASHCVDIFRRSDGSFGFEHYRREPEDQGRWTPVAYYSAARFEDEERARKAAVRAIAWLGDRLEKRP